MTIQASLGTVYRIGNPVLPQFTFTGGADVLRRHVLIVSSTGPDDNLLGHQFADALGVQHLQSGQPLVILGVRSHLFQVAKGLADTSTRNYLLLDVVSGTEVVHLDPFTQARQDGAYHQAIVAVLYHAGMHDQVRFHATDNTMLATAARLALITAGAPRYYLESFGGSPHDCLCNSFAPLNFRGMFERRVNFWANLAVGRGGWVYGAPLGYQCLHAAAHSTAPDDGQLVMAVVNLMPFFTVPTFDLLPELTKRGIGVVGEISYAYLQYLKATFPRLYRRLPELFGHILPGSVCQEDACLGVAQDITRWNR